MRYRERSSLNAKQLGVYQYYSLLGGSWDRYNVVSPSFEACFDELHRGPPYLDGGIFYKVSTRYEIPGVQAYIGNPTHYWSGQFINAQINHAGTVDYVLNDFNSVFGFDPSAMSKPPDVPPSSAGLYRNASPLKPGVNLGIDIGEALHDGLPHYPGSRSANSHAARLHNAVGFAKTVGDEYLNLAFGWAPLLSDLQRFVKTTQGLDQRLRQLARDNGRKVKRRLSFRSSDSSSAVVHTEAYYNYGYPIGLIDPGFFHGKGTRDHSRRTTVDKSFVGEFRYWIPDLPALPRGLHNLSIVYGLEPSPSLVWELTPWSWLLDWWGNVGDVLANVSSAALDNLVSTYAFYMEHHKSEWTGVDVFQAGGGISCPAHSVQEIKSRWPASPYGFGVEAADLSGAQLAILGALGLSKGL